MLMVSASVGCENNDSSSFPDCLMGNHVSRERPLEIWEWKYPEKTFYYLVSSCCDQFNQLFTENCEYVCSPDGGITGQGDGNCPDLSGEVTKRLLWKQKSD